MSLFDRYNRTELYQLCLRNGFMVRADESREAMISYLEGFEEPPSIPEEENAVHSWRLGLLEFLKDYWHKIVTQVVCPARGSHGQLVERACFGCIDTRVINCVIENGINEQLIETYRLNKEKRTYVDVDTYRRERSP